MELQRPLAVQVFPQLERRLENVTKLRQQLKVQQRECRRHHDVIAVTAPLYLTPQPIRLEACLTALGTRADRYKPRIG